MNQVTLKVNVYQSLIDSIGDVVNEKIEFQNLIHKVILPSSFVGSFYNMFEIFQNSMAITCYFKHLELFGTMIANLE
jgi:hypothetical protein